VNAGLAPNAARTKAPMINWRRNMIDPLRGWQVRA
jgi:hypothetical protein